MKPILAGLISVFLIGTVGCGNDPTTTAPTTTATAIVAATPTPPAPTTQTPATPTPTTPTPAAPTPVPAVVVTGGRGGCTTAPPIVPGEIVSWNIKVTNTPQLVHLVGIFFHTDKAGCDATVDNGRNLAVNGPTDYLVGQSGTTTYQYNTSQYNCGRVQVDVSNLVGDVINYKTDCPPPPVKASVTVGAVCVSAVGSFTTNITTSVMTNVAKVFVDGPGTNDLNFTANGTQNVPWPVGTYNWTATASTGAVFDNGLTTTTGTVPVVDCSIPPPPTCDVNVAPTLTVTPAPSVVNPATTFVASAGFKTGAGSLTWGDGSAAQPITNAGSLTHTYSQTSVDQTFTITLNVVSGALTCPKTVTVTIPKSPPPTCATIGLTISNTTAMVNSTNVTVNPTATFTGTGPTTVNWGDGTTGNVTSGVANPHTYTRTNTDQTFTVTFTDNQITPGCTQSFTVTVPKLPLLVCAPLTQTVNMGQTANVSANGGIGTYTWSAPGGTITTGSGSTFSTTYPLAGTDNITVTSGTQTATCQVILTDPSLICASITATITRPVIEGQPSTARFTIPTGITNAQVGFASYETVSAVFGFPQTKFDNSDQTLGSGVHDITINVPNCYYQLDAYCGTVILTLTPTTLYGSRLKDSANGGDKMCLAN